MTATFPHSPWSKIAELEAASESDRTDLLQHIFSIYWKPLYAFVCRQYPNMDPEDLTQNVFAYMIQRATLEKAEQARGRLRNFLITVTRGVASNGWRRDRHHRSNLQLDSVEGQSFIDSLADLDGESPDAYYDRSLAVEIFRRSVTLLELEYRQSGRAALFETLCPLATTIDHARYRKASARDGVSEETLRVQVFRFRQKLRDHFTDHVKLMVDDPSDLQDEITYLLGRLNHRGSI